MKRILSVCLVCCAGYGCGGRDPAPARNETPVSTQAVDPTEIVLPADSPKLKQLKIETVGSAEVPADEVTSPGKIEANPNKLAHVVLPVAGRIAQVFVKIGDAVQQGQVLLTVESPDVDAALSGLLQAEASVTQARAALTKSEADSDRAKDLFENNAIAKKEVLNQEAALAQSKAALDQSLAAEQQAKRKLEILGITAGQLGQHVAVRSPISGKVLEMTVVPGEFRNDLSQPVMTIADLSSVWITSDVPETSIRLIDPGERVDIELSAYPGEQFHGRVARIADTVDPQTRTVKVHAEIDNRNGRLRPEMFGKIHHVDSTRRVPMVPASAVIQGENHPAVFVELGPGRFKPVAVKLGDRTGDRFAVLDGLSAGSRVVTDGAMLLKGI